jgi:hypothetical protein
MFYSANDVLVPVSHSATQYKSMRDFWLQYNFILVSNCEDLSTNPMQNDYLWLVCTHEEKCIVQLEYNNQIESMTIKGMFNILPLFRRCLKEPM